MSLSRRGVQPPGPGHRRSAGSAPRSLLHAPEQLHRSGRDRATLLGQLGVPAILAARSGGAAGWNRSVPVPGPLDDEQPSEVTDASSSRTSASKDPPAGPAQ